MVAPALVGRRPAGAHGRAQGLHVLPHGPGRRGDPRRARPRRRRARPLPPAPAARRRRRPPARRRAARRGRLRLSFGGRQYSDNPRAIHEELARRGAPARAPLGGPRRRVRGARRARGVAAQEQPRVPRGARHRALRRHQRPHARLVPARRRPGGACRRCTGTRSAARASTSPRSAARRGGCSRGSTSRWRAGRTCSPRAGARPEFLRGAFGVEDGLLETGLPRTDVLAAEGRAARRAAVRRRARAARERAGSCSTRRPTARRRSTAAAASGSTSTPTSAGCATPPGPTRSCCSASTRSSPTRRRRRASGSSTSPSTPTARSCSPRPTCWSRTTPRCSSTSRRPGCRCCASATTSRSTRRRCAASTSRSRRRCPAPLLRTEDELAAALADPEAACAPFAGRREAFVAGLLPARRRRRGRPGRGSGVLLDSGRVAVHFVHIGKTGGTAIKHVLRPIFRAETETALGKVILHKGHTFKLADVPRGGQGHLLRARPALALRERVPQPPAQGPAEVLLRVVAGRGRRVRALPDAAGARRGARAATDADDAHGGARRR